jgi:hypothetical protein
MEADGMSPRHVAKHLRVDWSAADSRFTRKNQLRPTGTCNLSLELRHGNVWWLRTLREHSMRLALVLALSLAAVGGAHAQLQPITPPRNPYALPQPAGAARPVESDGFKPYKPPAYLNPALPSSAVDPYPHMRHTPGLTAPPPAGTAADPYPSLRRKHRTSDNHF